MKNYVKPNVEVIDGKARYRSTLGTGDGNGCGANRIRDPVGDIIILIRICFAIEQLLN